MTYAKTPIKRFETKARSAGEVLDRMDKILSSPKRWTQGARGVDQEGWPIDIEHASPCAVCLLGALMLSNPVDTAYGRTAKALRIASGDFTFVSFNDFSTTTFKDIKAVIAKAKELVSK